MITTLTRLATAIAALVIAFADPANAQDFYKGKTIRIVVGFSAGGGFDTYSRLIARHMGKHIPGNPTVVVENMTGAGSMIAANYIYNQAKPDGLTIGNWIGGLLLQQLFGRKGVEFDARKFEWIGVPVSDTAVCALTKASGVASVDQWFAVKEPLKIGGEAAGATTSDIPRVLAAALKLPLRLIEGYKGTADVRLAADSGEVAGGCWAWESVKVTWRKGLETGDVKVVIQAVAKRHPDLPNVANATEIAKTDEARQLLKAGVVDPGAMVRSYSLPPGTPKDRVKILGDAFMATMKDAEFVAEAKKGNLDLNPLPGDQVEAIAHGLFKLDAALVAKLKENMLPK